MLCIGVKKSYDSTPGHLLLDMINLNSSTNWFSDADDQFGDGTETVIPRHDSLNIISVTQLEKDTILVCYDSKSGLMSVLTSINCLAFCLSFLLITSLFHNSFVSLFCAKG